MTHVRTVGEVAFELRQLGPEHAQPLVVLHDAESLVTGTEAYLEQLAEQFRVLVPSHPGFGQSSLPDHFDTVGDLAYAYLDLLRDLFGQEKIHLVGLGFGGWIAAEIAVRCTHGLRSLVLVDALGIKAGGVQDRDIADIFVVDPDELLRISWHDPAVGAQKMLLPGRGALDEEQLTTLLRNRQSTALLGWKPFLHNPKLRRRLARIDVPTLVVWGESDGWVSVDYGRAFADAIPGARLVLIERAGHFPYLEQPDVFAETVLGWLPTLDPLDKTLTPAGARV
jgi:pimeloyl-ACP methyl ester carboxylesterase